MVMVSPDQCGHTCVGRLSRDYKFDSPLDEYRGTMSPKYIGTQFDKRRCKYRARIQKLQPAERSGFPEHLKTLTELTSNLFENEKDAAKAADK